MNHKLRQKSIINKIKMQGSVTTNELIDEFDVSVMTIRRDLQSLENEGYITLVHGGAKWNNHAILEHPMSLKQTEYSAQKRRIGQYCATLVNENDLIFIGTGTTTQVVGEELINLDHVTLYTNSLMAMESLSSFSNIELHSTPGKYRALSHGFLGSETIQFLKHHLFDYVFISTEGIDLSFGASVPALEDALTKQAVIEQAKHIILISDHTKFNKTFNHQFCTLDQVEMIITDSELDDETFQSFLQKGIKIVRV